MVRRYLARRWTCEPCERIETIWAWDDAETPCCPNCAALMVSERPAGKGPLVIGDACDVWMPHAICHEDGTPRRYTSKSEMKRVAAAKGYMNVVEHKPMPGTDKSPHTTRWV